MPSPSPILRRSYTFILVSLLLFRLVFPNNRLSIFSFRQVEMIEYLEYLFSVLCEDGMSSRSFFRTAAGVTEEPKADWHVLLAIIFERSAFLRQWLLCALLLFPPPPPKKLPENRVSRTRKLLLFQFPHPTYMVSHFPPQYQFPAFLCGCV